MKRIFAAFISLFVLLALFACGPEEHKKSTKTVDGLEYTLSLDESSYTLSGVATRAESYTAVAQIDGIPVLTVSNSCFYNDTEVKSITLPEGYIKIGAYAFDNCYALEELKLSDTITEIGFDAFNDCTSLAEIRLPKSLKKLAKGAFARCEALNTVYFGEAIEQIGSGAFERCVSLREIHIENPVKWAQIKIDDYNASPMNYAEEVYSGGELLRELQITGVEAVSDRAFYKFPSLERVSFGEGVKVIGLSAFSDCAELKNLYIGNTVSEIKTSAFNSCSSLESVSMGMGLKKVGGLAFYGCENLVSLNIADLASWCAIDFYTDNSGTANPMRYADKLYVNGSPVGEWLTVPDGVESIRGLAFISLKVPNVILPAGLLEIEENAFYETEVKAVYFMGFADAWMALVPNIGGGNFNQDTQLYVNPG